MLKFITSLSFLYGLTIVILIIYGLFYYREFTRAAIQRKRFPIIFLVIGIACFSFLWINIHAPLKLQTFSNLDHHFIRHDGFIVSKSIELGRTDTVNFDNNPYNSFVFTKKNNQVTVASKYSEDPFYTGADGKYQLLSASWTAPGHTIAFTTDSVTVSLRAVEEDNFELKINNQSFATSRQIRKGLTGWNLFKDENGFLNSSYYNDEKIINGLRNILLVRDDVSRKEAGSLKFFVSGRIFQSVVGVRYDSKKLGPAELAFSAPVADRNLFAWGVAFLDNNRNQYRLKHAGADSFIITNRYPVAYPLTEEKNDDWSQHQVTKFLLSDRNDMLNMAPVFREGFLFPAFDRDVSVDFSPVLLTYQKSAGNKPPGLKVQWLNKTTSGIQLNNDKLVLPAKSTSFSWLFSIQNTFNWEFSSRTLSSATWQWLLFGGLFIFFALVFFTSLITPAERLSWVWQLLASITLVLLTTRFFLYWRYKSFPPYEGMDLPSQQQLNSFWNFGIIIFAAIVLAIIFGFGGIKYAWQLIRKQMSSVAGITFRTAGRTTPLQEKVSKSIAGSFVVKRFGSKLVFFVAWLCILFAAAGMAFIKQFDPAACRHLAIGLIIAYFIFLFISYRHSPLAMSSRGSWWSINTQNKLDLVISNPVKVLLSISLLAVFVFIDIGFAIVFLNFILFNEAFLSINYAIAGLSTGSRRNAALFGTSGFIYLLAFILNLLYAPYIFQWLLNLPQTIYLLGYIIFAVAVAYHLLRLFPALSKRKKAVAALATTSFMFALTFLFFPKEKILDKAAMTKYRVAVLTMPVDKAIEEAYREGKTYEPVIRAAQNQWFINTLIYEENNPSVERPGFHLIQHSPQNKGAKYNAQATDLVASRFFLAEHGKWSVLLYVLLLLLPTTMLASFYKLYPDFTNRTNSDYPTITSGFSIFNYLVISALLVILAATGRYIFFGQDMPFGSILSKQSILFPAILIVVTVILFKTVPAEYYANRKKVIPGLILFSVLAFLLFFVKPVFNKNKEFNAGELAKEMESFISLRLQPVMDYIDTSRKTRRLTVARKDELFSDSVRKLIAAGAFEPEKKFFMRQAEAYTRAGFSRHLDQSQALYLDLYSGKPELAVNNNFFRVEPPPHLQQSWTGNVFGDSTVYNISVWDNLNRTITKKRVTGFTNEPNTQLDRQLMLSFRSPGQENAYRDLYLVNTSNANITIKLDDETHSLGYKDSIKIYNPWKAVIIDSGKHEKLLTVEPDAFMRNYFVNGNRSYVYPMAERFIWARNFAESIASNYSTGAGQREENAVISFDYEMMDSLSLKIQKMVNRDTAYKKGAEYGICIADGNGRLIAMVDFIKGLSRPDPNDKAGFNKAITGENGSVSQSLLRKQIGNINLLRMNPGPGSTFKPIVFSAIASQMNLDWDAFSSQGFDKEQKYFGGERVAGYDFENNNGQINNIVDYLKYSDNYYHSNVLLLGSYPKQAIPGLLSAKFEQHNPDSTFHWPYFNYSGKTYWLDGFENWPGYLNGSVNLGMDSSFTSVGLLNNYGIFNGNRSQSFDMFSCCYDSLLFMNAYKRSGFILPEYSVFDQQGSTVNRKNPYEVFATCFRGHVKGSSQVLVPPAKMVDAFGKLVTQSRNYSLTLNPYATPHEFYPFAVDNTIVYNNYLSMMREGVFAGMREALNSGTAAALGVLLKKHNGYFYYGKTGTTGDNEVKTKSKLMTVIISKKDITDPAFNFRNNKFYTIYFTSQNGPAKQNEAFQNEIIEYVERSMGFNRYMNGEKVTESKVKIKK